MYLHAHPPTARQIPGAPHLAHAKGKMADDKSPTNSLEVAPAKRNIPYERTFAETFDVLVGCEHNQQLFTVHHDIVTRRSKFFRQA